MTTLRPELAEIFFAPRLVLVEGHEDVAFVFAALVLEHRWDEFRGLNAQIIPADRKSQLLQPLIVARDLGIQTYLMFDADGNETHPERRAQHERDNITLLTACGVKPAVPFPASTFWGNGVAVWPETLAVTVASEIGKAEWERLGNLARADFDPGGSFEKNSMFISRRLELAWIEGRKSQSLLRLCDEVVSYFG